jgi:hypothetical protein
LRFIHEQNMTGAKPVRGRVLFPTGRQGGERYLLLKDLKINNGLQWTVFPGDKVRQEVGESRPRALFSQR